MTAQQLQGAVAVDLVLWRIHLSYDVNIREELALHAAVSWILEESLTRGREVLAVVEHERIVQRGLALRAVLLKYHPIPANTRRMTEVELHVRTE